LECERRDYSPASCEHELGGARHWTIKQASFLLARAQTEPGLMSDAQKKSCLLENLENLALAKLTVVVLALPDLECHRLLRTFLNSQK
jgi:hypothetical protein